MSDFPELFASPSTQLAIGSVIIIAVALQRFGTPEELRSQTTALRYHCAAAMYCLMALFLFYFIALSPHFALLLAKPLLGIELPDDISGLRETLPSPVFALLLILAMPQLPKVAAADDRVRAYYQRLANIPFQAQLLSARLVDARCRFDEKLRRQLDERLAELAFAPQDLVRDERTTRCWLKVNGLCMQMRRWSADERYHWFCSRFPKMIDTVLDELERATPGARDTLKRRRLLADLERELGEKIEDRDLRVRICREMKSILGAYEGVFGKRLDALHQRTCDVISRAILASFQSHKSRSEALTALGFQIRRPIGIGTDQLIFATAAVFAAVCAVLTVGRSLLPATDAPPVVIMALLVTTSQLVAITIAALSQRPETICAHLPLRHRPYGHYLRLAMLAGALSSPLPVVFFFVVWLSGPAVEPPDLAGLVVFMPIALLASGTAVFTAFNIDNGVSTRPAWAGAVPVERLCEGLGQGLAQALWFWFVMTRITMPLAESLGVTLPMRQAGVASIGWLGVPVLPLCVAFVAGTIVGLLVPTMYRDAYGESTSASPPAVTPPGESKSTADTASAAGA